MNASPPNGVSAATQKVNGLRLDASRPQTNGHNSTPTPSAVKNPRHTYSRKESNPLAPAFLISAPGKTIVFGEHAVVHGKAAIAAAISLRSYLLVTTLTKSQRTVRLRFVDIGLDHTWNISDLPWKAFSHPARKKRYYDLVTSLDKELVDALRPHTEHVSADLKDTHKRKVHRDAASCFLYLFLSLGNEHSAGCIYTLRSTIPIGQGLGSSGSVSVCLSTALLIQSRALAGPHPDQQEREASEQLERINRWAFVGEMVIHGNPSGVDNTVSTHGHAVLFQRKDYSKPPHVSVLRDFPELPLLLVDTNVPKSTAAEVAKVAALVKIHPTVGNCVLDAIDAVVRSAHDIITTYDFSEDSEPAINKLGELMSVNHGLLCSLGVSHPKLDRLRQLVDQANVGWTKLTGAGGGGCAITLLKPESGTPQSSQLNGEAAHPPPPDEHSSLTDRMRRLESQLDQENFTKFETLLGGDGVGVLYPAIINDEEIDQEMFLTATGSEGVEELVGDKIGEESPWRYWQL